MATGAGTLFLNLVTSALHVTMWNSCESGTSSEPSARHSERTGVQDVSVVGELWSALSENKKQNNKPTAEKKEFFFGRWFSLWEKRVTSEVSHPPRKERFVPKERRI